MDKMASRKFLAFILVTACTTALAAFNKIPDVWGAYLLFAGAYVGAQGYIDQLKAKNGHQGEG